MRYIVTVNFANNEKILKEYATLPIEDWMGVTWPPNMVHKNRGLVDVFLWQL